MALTPALAPEIIVLVTMQPTTRLPLILGLLLVATWPGALFAATVDVPYTNEAPVISASSGWHEGHTLFVFDALYVLGDNDVEVFGLWDEQALYLAALVSDGDLYATESLPRDSSLMWQNDTIELLFDPTLKGGALITQGDQAFRQYIFTIAGGVFDAYGCCQYSETSFDGTATFHVTLDGTLNGAGNGYLLEAQIPWSDLGITPSHGLEIGFDVANDDRDSFGQATAILEADWAGLTDTFAQPNAWGRLRLQGSPDGGLALAGDGGAADASAAADDATIGGTAPPTGGPQLPTPEASGCGCRLSAATPAPGWVAGLGLVALLGLPARRRRRRSALQGRLTPRRRRPPAPGSRRCPGALGA